MHARNGIEDADSMAGPRLIEEPEEIAQAAVLLAGNDFITGTTLKVDGGRVADHGLH